MNGNKYWFWWIPGFLTFPIMIVSPSLGRTTILATIVILIFLRVWVKRTRSRVLYINSMIDKGVVFDEATIRDQLQRRRKAIVLNHQNVKAYTRTTQMLTLTMAAMVVFIYVYANYYWVKYFDMKNVALYKDVFADSLKQGAIYTSISGGLLMVLCCLFAFLRCRYYAKLLKDPNQPDEKELTPEEKEAKVKDAEEKAKTSGGFLASAARRTVSEESEEKLEKAKAATAKAGSLAAKAQMDVSDKPWQSLDEKIEMEHREAMKKADDHAES